MTPRRTRTPVSETAPMSGADVLVVGNESRTTLAAARSLSRNEIPFVVLSDRRGMLAASRYVRSHTVIPAPTVDRAGFARSLLDEVRRANAPLLVPTYDSALDVCNAHRDELREAGARLAAASADAVRNVLDKEANLETARRLGIPCPRQASIASLDEAPALAEELGFPVVLKRPSADASTSRFPKWSVARDTAELIACLDVYPGGGPFPLMQERLTGSIVGLYCFAVRGEIVAMFCSRAKRRAAGQNVLREIIPLDARLAEHARSLLRYLDWDGVAALAFFETGDRGVRYLETNGRLWGGLEGAIRAGWDVPSWVVRYFREGEAPRPGPIEVGSRCCWRFGDLAGLAAVFAGNAWLTDREHVGRMRAVGDYLSAFRPRIGSDVFRFDDPLPELVEHWDWILPALSRTVGRAKRSARQRIGRE